jgi:four helix bundle protein
MFKFQKLKVWEKSRKLSKVCFSISNSLPQRYQFSFGDQLRRAVLSVSNNIAEGSGRKGVKEQSNFYNIAKGSVYEVVNILIILSDLGLLKLSESDKVEIYNLSDEICRMLSGLIKRKNAK